LYHNGLYQSKTSLDIVFKALSATSTPVPLLANQPGGQVSGALLNQRKL
jgi:hypothetical protein